jgi:hypothetical protein
MITTWRGKQFRSRVFTIGRRRWITLVGVGRRVVGWYTNWYFCSASFLFASAIILIFLSPYLLFLGLLPFCFYLPCLQALPAASPLYSPSVSTLHYLVTHLFT